MEPPLILFHPLNDSVHRFAQLRRQLPGISERMQTQQLCE
ncbi:MAG: winged helix-turn-helix transcriptional regulator [Spirulinaceae cyanobacterium RM2_2_10]|nr:winged helix-turn-helix transcriptional regulator [Spirulinaceae cyanobacterium SM2_1_0]NJO20101.1 winged helix-turn-helix transcriptional regulator [Spirulinaceae cyanobacterium RM2_2_10]